MSDFSASWLALREPYDRRARDPVLLEQVAAAFSDRTSITVVDLACGTGATLRALAPVLRPRQNWRLIDNDLSLLARIEAPPAAAGVILAPTPVDLARDLELALDGAVDLVTTSAFLDLVSPDWLDRLAVEAAARGLPVYAALTYDGDVVFTPTDPFDDRVMAGFNRHQRIDKGFGPALGPAAARAMATAFTRVGYAVESRPSEWRLGPEDAEIQLELVSGFAAAAREVDEIALPDIVGWISRRRAAVEGGGAGLRIGHVDAFARTTGKRWGDRSQSNSTSSPIG